MSSQNQNKPLMNEDELFEYRKFNFDLVDAERLAHRIAERYKDEREIEARKIREADILRKAMETRESDNQQGHGDDKTNGEGSPESESII